GRALFTRRYLTSWLPAGWWAPCGPWFFFFQAEDGIRDRNVTGVQTCALPISTERGRDHALGHLRRIHGRGHLGDPVPGRELRRGRRLPRAVRARRPEMGQPRCRVPLRLRQPGDPLCRLPSAQARPQRAERSGTDRARGTRASLERWGAGAVLLPGGRHGRGRTPAGEVRLPRSAP